MLGLFGTLNLGIRSLSTQQQGMEVSGHNLANVNNPAYARQRLSIQTSVSLPTTLGPQGTGAEAVAITQIRSALLDRQVQSETSISGSLTAQQQALQLLQSDLGQQIDRQAIGAEGTTAAQGSGSSQGLAEGLSDLFSAFQSVSTNPTSMAERQVLVITAQRITSQFNQVAQRLSNTERSLNESLQTDVDQANQAIQDIAKLNEQITATEVGGAGQANDLRDQRQKKLEELAKLVNFTSTSLPSGAIDISIGGVSMTSGAQVIDRVETYDAGNGQLMVRAQTAGTSLALSSGSIQGTIEVRDGETATLKRDINDLATRLVDRVNTLHRNGYGLTGTTGEDFFTGTDATSINVNSRLVTDPALIQASGTVGATGDNQVMLALAQLANERLPEFNAQTFNERYGQSVAALGESLASLNTQIDNQDAVSKMLLQQRDSLSGVSLDEEMTDLIKYQKAFQASARLITTLDTMLDTIVNLKR
jgi:flagellar hook-associated protein 1